MFETLERIFTTPELLPAAGILIGLAGGGLAFVAIIAKTLTTIHKQTINGNLKRDLIEQGVSPAECEEYSRAFNKIDVGTTYEPAKQQAH